MLCKCYNTISFFLQYTRSAQCYMIVYSITHRRSLDEAQDIYRFCQRVKDEEQVPAVSACQRWFCVAMVMHSAMRVRLHLGNIRCCVNAFWADFSF